MGHTCQCTESDLNLILKYVTVPVHFYKKSLILSCSEILESYKIIDNNNFKLFL